MGYFCGADSILVEYCGLNLDAAVREFAISTLPGIYMRHYLTVRGCLRYVEGPADMILNCAVFVFSIGTYFGSAKANYPFSLRL